IIGSTGWFYGQHLPPFVHQAEVAQLAQIMERDVLEGTADGGIRAGVIGEIGWSDNEMLIRSARCSKPRQSSTSGPGYRSLPTRPVARWLRSRLIFSNGAGSTVADRRVAHGHQPIARVSARGRAARCVPEF